jgi:UDP-glucose 4-epimerase
MKRLIDLNAPVNSTLGRGELISIHEILKQYFQEFEQLDVEIKSRSQITRPSLYADLQEINSKIGNWSAEKTTSQTLREMLQSNNSALNQE